MDTIEIDLLASGHSQLLDRAFIDDAMAPDSYTIHATKGSAKVSMMRRGSARVREALDDAVRALKYDANRVLS